MYSSKGASAIARYFYITVSIFLALGFFSGNLKAATLYLDSDEGEYEAYKYFDYFMDKNNSIQTPKELEDSGKLQANTSGQAVLGYQQGAVWLRLKVTNLAAERRQWSIYFSSMQMREIYYYRGAKDQTPYLKGHGISKDRLSEKSYANTLPLDLAPGESQILYFKTLSSRGSINATLSTPAVVQKSFMIVLATRWGHFSILLLLMAVTLTLYAYNRDLSYLLYTIFLVTMIIRMTIPSNILNMLFDGIIDIDFQDYMGFAIMTPIASVSFFTVSFVKTATYAPRMGLLLKIIGSGTIILALLALGPLKDSIHLYQDWANNLASPVVIWAATLSLRAGYQPAKLYLVGWGALLTGVVIWTSVTA